MVAHIYRANSYNIRHRWGTEWVVRDDLHIYVGVIRLTNDWRLRGWAGAR